MRTDGMFQNARVVKTTGRKRTRAPSLIRNKTQIIREAGLLIVVLEEALAYRPTERGNAYQPELWRQLDLENPVSFKLISELVAELKKLNAFLEKDRRAKTSSRAVTDFRKVGIKVLTTYGNTVALGAGLLTIGALCSLLHSFGAGDIVDNAMLWRKIGR